MAASITDNSVQERGPGNWKVITYNPPLEYGPFRANLTILKDSYCFSVNAGGTKKYLLELPRQNVSSVYDADLVLTVTRVEGE